MKKRMLSVLLALCMVLTLLPAEALAEEFDELLDRSGTRTEEEDVAGIETEPDAENTVETEPEPDEENTAEPEQNGEVPTEIGAEQDEDASGDGAEDTESGVSPQADGDVVQYTLDNGAVLSVDASTGTVTKCVPGSATEVDIPGEIPVLDSETGGGVDTVAVTGIGVSAFNNRSSLTSVTIPEGVTGIGKQAFKGCRSLTSVTIPESVTSIGEEAFSGCSSLKSVTIPEGVTGIGYRMFYGCSSLTSVNIPGSVTGIGQSAFYGCSGLTNVTIPEGVTSIGDSVFEGCSGLASVTIPGSVTNIGGSAFRVCSGLTSVTIPESVTSIGTGAFSFCSGLTSVAISENLSSIEDGVFSNCGSLISVTIPESVTSIGSSTFRECGSLISITIPEGVTSIGDSAFYGCAKLKNMIIPESVTSIGASAFSNCWGLTSVTVPEGVTSIGSLAFTYCGNLKNVTILGSATRMANGVFQGCGKLTSAGPIGGDYAIQFGWTKTIPYQAFMYCTSLTAVTVPEGVTSIDSYAFSNCTALTSVTIPEGVTSIGERAFNGCEELTGLTIPKSMNTIGRYAFVGCSGLTSVTIPEGVTSIKSSAFSGCTGLTSVAIREGVTSIGDSAFSYCSGLTSVTVPGSVTSIGERAFYNCSGLTSVTIPDSVTSIGSSAFFNTSPDFILYCYPDSYAESYAQKNNIKYELLTLTGRTLSVAVCDEDGAAVGGGFTVTWYDEDDNEIGTSNTLVGADNEKTYSFVITLGDDLAALYEQPERGTIAPSDPAKCEVRLVKKAEVKTLTLSGHVADQDGAPIQGAAVTITPAGGDAVEVTTGTDGGFRAEVPYGVVSIIIRMDGYYSKRETLDLTNETGDAYDAGTYTLAPVQVITDRVTLSVTQRRAAEEADGAMELPLSSLGAMEVSVTGKDSADFEVQGLALVFKTGAVRAGEEITVTITDPSGAYCAASTTVELDGSRLGSAEMTMIQKGSLVLGGVSGPNANLLLFDSGGNCVLTRAAEPGLSSRTLEAGSYRAVLIQKSELLRGVSKLDYLGTFGLNAESDYLLKEVAIADGKITRLADCAVPTLDEGRISYTRAENTGVSTSKPSGVSVGEMLMVRAAYELDKTKGTAVDSLQIVLPEGVSLTGTSATIDGKTAAYTYDAAKREVKISTTGRDKAVVWLCCTPETGGSHSIGAFLTLSNGASQPIGAAVVQAENAKLNVPERTGKAEGLTASGRTMPGCTVTLYDNDEEVGTAVANAAGNWNMSFSLAAPVYSYSYHNIYAVISGGSLIKPIQMESVLVTYDKRLDVELKKITMYNTAHDSQSLDAWKQETIFDFTNSTAPTVPYYRIWPSRYPTFTFKAEFSGDNSKLEDVYVVTTNSAGDKTYVKTKYDETSGAWVGTHNYTSFDAAPVAVTAAYGLGDAIELIMFDEIRYADVKETFVAGYRKFENELDDVLNSTLSLTDVVANETSFTANLTYTDTTTQQQSTFATYQIETFDVSPQTVPETLEAEGYIKITDPKAGDNIWIKMESPTTTKTRIKPEIQQTYVNLADSTALRIIMSLNQSDLDLDFDSIGSLIELGQLTLLGFGVDDFMKNANAIKNPSVPTMSDAGGLLAGLFLDVAENNHNNKKWLNVLSGNLDRLQSALLATERLMEIRCADGSRKLPDGAYNATKKSLEAIELQVVDYGSTGRKNIMQVGIAVGACVSISFPGKAVATLTPKYKWAERFMALLDCGVFAAEQIIGDPVDRYLEDTYNDIARQLLNLATIILSGYKDCDTAPESEALLSSLLHPTARPVTYIADPSGYVYEAVPSNRLEGVTATISSQAGGNWNAAAYDQINPQSTGADGGYYWDVPQGNWKVSFTKAGYENADTSSVSAAVGGWLPVPPPQLEVNVGMVSTAAPAVKQAAVYTDRVEVEFSQYMDIASVRGALSLMHNSTALSGCTVEALNAEYNPENTKQYATRFSVTVNGGSLPGGLTVSVSANAKNYAGTPLAAVYTSEALTASVRPTEIDSPGLISIGLHETAHIPVVLHPNAAGWPLIVESLSPALVSVETPRVTTGTSGGAEISVVGSLPGSGLIRITEPATGLSKTITLDVAHTSKAPAAAVAPVTAVLEDGRDVVTGMKLLYGAKITLRTSTQGASIRYTIDDTCPCAETALFYGGPIELTGAVVLRAAAYKDGVYSETIRLELDVEKTAPSAAVVTAILLADKKTVRITDPDSVLTGNVTVLAVCYEEGRMMDTAFGKAFENGLVSFGKALGENYVLYFLASDSWIPFCEKVSLKTRSGS